MEFLHVYQRGHLHCDGSERQHTYCVWDCLSAGVKGQVQKLKQVRVHLSSICSFVKICAYAAYPTMNEHSNLTGKGWYDSCFVAPRLTAYTV